jgi:hypothetical protein
MQPLSPDETARGLSALASGHVYWIYGIFHRVGVIDAHRGPGALVVVQRFLDPPYIFVLNLRAWAKHIFWHRRSGSQDDQTLVSLTREAALYQKRVLREARVRKTA